MSALDPVTHFLTGACLSRAGLNRTTGLATLTMVLATEIPDIDVLWFFGGSVTGFAHHRGFTHTLLGAPVMAAITVGGVYGLYRLLRRRPRRKARLEPRWGLLLVYALAGVLVHIFQDFTNNYGVRPLAPFHPRWYSWDIVSIIDPIMLAALTLGLLVPALFGLVTEEVGAGPARYRGRGGALFALFALAAIIGMRDFEHRRAVTALNSITYRGEDPIRASAFPYPLNPFTWGGVVETHNFFEIVQVNSSSGEVDPSNEAVLRFKPAETPVTLAAKKSRLGRVYLDWAQYPFLRVQSLPGNSGYRVQFQDLRFAYDRTLSRSSSSPLSGYVELDPQLIVIDQYMGAPPDRERPR
jgi:inner membrane protein